jgi:hypothetical protein
VRIKASDWKENQLAGDLPKPAPASQLHENQVFRKNVERLWRGAADVLLTHNAQKDTWLVAEVSDPQGGLRVADVPNNNRAALLLVRAFTPDPKLQRRGAAGRGGN